MSVTITPTPKCSSCLRIFMSKNLRDIKCSKCDRLFHIKCTNLKSKAEYISMKFFEPWSCHICVKPPKKKISNPVKKVSCQNCSNFFT